MNNGIMTTHYFWKISCILKVEESSLLTIYTVAVHVQCIMHYNNNDCLYYNSTPLVVNYCLTVDSFFFSRLVSF